MEDGSGLQFVKFDFVTGRPEIKLAIPGYPIFQVYISILSSLLAIFFLLACCKFLAILDKTVSFDCYFSSARGTQRFVSANICREGVKSPQIFGFNCTES